jgi:hypothetical protein
VSASHNSQAVTISPQHRHLGGHPQVFEHSLTVPITLLDAISSVHVFCGSYVAPGVAMTIRKHTLISISLPTALSVQKHSIADEL